MRLLHTSDWHLGRSMGEHRLLDDQRAFIAWLVEVVEDEAVDLVVIAGDIFDRAVAPTEAVSLLRDGLGALRAAGAEVALIAGNHDSGERLAAYDGLTDAAGVLIRGGYPAQAATVVRSIAGDDIALVAVPYLDPLVAPAAFRPPADDAGAQARATHESVLRQALDEAREAVAADVPSIAIAHAFVAGSTTSESERELSIGTATQVGVDLFDGFTYTALGHLHQPQRVAGRDAVRYSGTPLPYSFSETRPKEVLIVDLDDTAAVRSLPVPVGRPVATVRGTLDELVSIGPTHEHHRSFVRVELTDVGAVLDARRRLDEAFTHVVEIQRVADGPADPTDAERTSAAEVRSMSSLQLAERFWQEVRTDDLDDDQRSVLIDALETAERAVADA